MKLFHKLLLLILALTVLPLAGVGYKALTSLRTTIIEDVQTMYRERVQNNLTLISGFMDNLYDKIEKAVRFRKLGEMNEEQAQQFVRDVVRQFDEMAAITVLDEIGGEIASGIDSENLSPEGLLAHLKTLEPARIEEVLRQNDRYSGIYLVKQRPRITVFSPFKLQDRPSPGLVAAGVDLGAVQKMVDEIKFSKSEDGAALLFDSSGRLIAGKMRGKTLDDLRDFEKHPLVERARANRKNITASIEEFADSKGNEQMGAFAFLEKLDWMLLIFEPKKEVLAYADVLLNQTVGIILFTITISVVLGLLFARRLVKPIQALVRGAQEVGSGNLDYRIERLSNDEIGQLCDSFTQMGASLKRREETIARIRAIASELSTIFDKGKVIEVGGKAMVELTHCGELRVFLMEGEALVPSWRLENGGELANEAELLPKLKELADVARLADVWRPSATGKPLAALLVPLVFNDPAKGRIMKGCAVLGGGAFSDLDLQVAQILSGAITISLMNIGFLMESVDNERRSHELAIAELVQRTLYPDKDPEIAECELHSFIKSSSETGGDWYGYLENKKDSLFTILIGDVTGHGAPAALLTSATNAFFKTIDCIRNTVFAGRDAPFDMYSPKFLLSLLNHVILETAHGRLVMTFFVATIDLKTGRMVCANAGHNAPWIYRKDPGRVAKSERVKVGSSKVKIAGAGTGKIKIASKVKVKTAESEPGAGEPQGPTWENLNARGMRLGETVTSDFEELTTQICEGDILAFYTDGFLENTSPAKEEFGKKRMRAALEEKSGAPVKEMVENLCERSYEFYGDCPRADDLTIILARVRAPWPKEDDPGDKTLASTAEAPTAAGSMESPAAPAPPAQESPSPPGDTPAT